jgi:ribosomal protein S12 methylthiotransferase
MEAELKQNPVRVGLISLGCAKNLVDAEIMLGALLKDGAEITNDPAKADVVIVNTCSFIDSAQEESIDAILESAEVREANNRGQGLVVSGCLPQRFREELPKLLPEVDAFMGIDQVSQVGTIVRQALERRNAKLQQPVTPSRLAAKSRLLSRLSGEDALLEHGHTPRQTGRDGVSEEGHTPIFQVHARPTYIPDFGTPRFRLTPNHFAYVKIAEGCNHPCSFCIIPRMRGTHRSRSQQDIVAEARQLIASGVKELNLISQDSTYYGLDLRPDHRPSISSPEKFNAAVQSLPVESVTLCSLLRELDALPGDFWIRILYTHPAHWTDELIATIAHCRKVARYIDIPLQHIHENMLERMRRETSQEYIVELLNRIRAGVPGITLRTTFIVGFPGETEPYFGALLKFIEASRFERLGVFTYSQQEGTRAGSMAGQISPKVKKQRRDRAMATQHKIAVAVAESFVGRTMKVLVEKKASATELRQAKISSWEHGMIRETDSDRTKLKGRFLVGRGEADAPDIDGRVYIRGELPLGQFAQVKVVGHTDYDLIAEPQS